MEKDDVRKKINELVKKFFEKKEEKFIPGETPIYTGLAIYDDKEINAVINSLLEGWFGLGTKGKEFETKLAEFLNNKFSLLSNSGSSANLLALNGIKLKNNLSGGEVISPACAFPTTVNPIIQLGFKPAFVDVDKTFNITPELIDEAITKNTKGIVFAHTLGNPARIDEIMEIAREHNLFVLEDCCDALNSRYANRICGSWGDASTFSFYPAHIITMGEGGAISMNDPELYKTVRSLRDWGRDCWCSNKEHNINGACGKRFDYKIDGVPYDHKYIFSQIGYNLKPLDIQAAMGLEQLNRIEEFSERRKLNFRVYQEEFSKFSDYFDLIEVNRKADPVFFGFPLTINNPKIKRNDLTSFLNKNKIATRLLFGGNILRQPAYKKIKYAQYGDLKQSDKIMKNCFWMGLHPGVTQEQITYVMSKFKEYINKIK